MHKRLHEGKIFDRNYRINKDKINPSSNRIKSCKFRSKLSFPQSVERESRLNEPPRYPIKELGYDKSGIRKNRTGCF